MHYIIQVNYISTFELIDPKSALISASILLVFHCYIAIHQSGIESMESSVETTTHFVPKT